MQTQQLSVVDQRRNELTAALITNADLVKALPVNVQEKFKQNFLDMVTQDYLISTINPREIIRFTANLTRAGLSINPADKEVYVVPFNTEVRKQKVMLPQAIIPLNGIQEQAFQKGFFLRLYAVYKLGDEFASEINMTRQQQAMLNTVNPKWVNDNFVGFDVVLIDLQKELPEQTKFIEISYMREVTKTIKDIRFQLQTWRHKAVRRALGDFFMPKGRKIDIFDEVEHLNDNILKENEAFTDVDMTPLKSFEELQSGLAPLGITLSFNDGLAIANGNVYASAKTLGQLGFKVVDNNYVIATTTPAIEASLIEVNSVDEQPTYPVSPEIEKLLQSIGLELQLKDGWVKVLGNTNGLEDRLYSIGITYREKEQVWVGHVSKLIIPTE
ncbi:MAG: hypothetical protein WCW84_13565 [Sulfurimonas sp.]|jgi:hypothetical protein